MLLQFNDIENKKMRRKRRTKRMATKLAKKTVQVTPEMMLNYLREYNELGVNIKAMETRRKELADTIKNYAEQNGVKDDKGSSYVENDRFIYGRVARTSAKLNQEKTLTYLRENGFTDPDFLKENDLESAIKQVEQVDEDVLESYIVNGIISTEDFETLVDKKTTYSVTVNEKEEVVEAEKAEPVVAKKPTLKAKRGR